MAFAQVLSHSEQFGGSGSHTTSAVNTSTGSPTLCIVQHTVRASDGSSLSDSAGNTWTHVTVYGGSGVQTQVNLYYCNNFTTSSSHTFTVPGAAIDVTITTWTGNRTASDPKDQINGQWISSTAGANTPGSITPTVNNCLIISTVMDIGGTNPTLPTGYTLISKGPTGTAFAWGTAYKIQTTASAENPNWGGSTGSNAAINVVSFMPPAVAPTNTGNFFAFF